MKSASVRDLRYRFPEIERLLGAGETVEITKHGRAVARLAPVCADRMPQVPDIMARLDRLYGDRVLPAADLIAWDRDRS